MWSLRDWMQRGGGRHDWLAIMIREVEGGRSAKVLERKMRRDHVS